MARENTTIALMQKDITEIGQDIKEIKEDIKCLDGKYVEKNIFSEIIKAINKQSEIMDKRIMALEDNNKWIVRAVLGTIISTIIGGLFVFKFGN